MATTVAAMKGRLGNTDYYILSMKARELVDKVVIPKELDGWDEMSIEERYQRDINYNRVRSQIAPYLANTQERFFGAIIVMAINSHDSLEFELLSDVASNKALPGRYKIDAQSMGFLTFGGGETLVPLDGQHRLKAIEFAISGKDERGKDIRGITPCFDLANEDVTVILIPEDPNDSKQQARHKARHIFSRVNKYARSTTTGQNIITDDDDYIAVLARRVANDIIGARLVKYTSNTIRAKDQHFTTLSVIYNCNENIVNEFFPSKLDKTKLPEKSQQELYWQRVAETWIELKDSISVFSECLEDSEESGDVRRIETRQDNLLGRPVTQECLVKAFVRLTSPRPEGEEYKRMNNAEASRKLNEIPWVITSDNINEWDRILWTGGVDSGKMITKNRPLATRIIAYRAGEILTDDEEAQLLEDYRSLFPEQDRGDLNLPPKV